MSHLPFYDQVKWAEKVSLFKKEYFSEKLLQDQKEDEELYGKG